MSEKVKHTVTDSVFCSLFRDPKYQLELFQTLHPDRKDVTTEDITDVTLRPIFLTHQYNDLGFTVQDKAVFLVEAQSTWCPNLPLRALMYLGDTYREYLHRTEQFEYGGKPVVIPKPELYVLYTGDYEHDEDQLSVADVHWGGDASFVDVKVRVLYGKPEGKDILSQYVAFTRILNLTLKKNGRTKEAVQEAIKECIKKGILDEYLKLKEVEVVDTMTFLFDQKYNEKMYGISKYKEGREEGLEEGQIKTILKLFASGVISKAVAMQELAMTEEEFDEAIAKKVDNAGISS